uniref:Glycosyl transferase n=1 Tax=Caenorhabditis tropicalis TaxID=1561998 RepID=A0A1I7TU27_9PELO
MPPPDTRKTLQISMFTFKNGRGLGQQLFEMASLLGISKQIGRVPVITRYADVWDTVTNSVTQYFPVFGMNFEQVDMDPSSLFSVNLNIRFCCKYENPLNLNSLDQQHLLINGVYFQSFKYFDEFRPEIRLALTPPIESAIRAEMQIPDDFRKDLIICVHTKQPVYREMSLSGPSDPVFTRKATDFLVSKYKTEDNRVTVAVLGNDILWAQNLFHDKIGKSNYFSNFNDTNSIADSPEYTVSLFHKFRIDSKRFQALLTVGLSPIDDLAFSRSFCDVFFLSAPTSSIGWWMAYLSKDTVEVYYR